MTAKTITLANKFIERASILDSTRSKMEALLAAGNIGISDIEQVYAGLYLDIFTDFEAMIEDLFIGLLSGQLYSQTHTVSRNVKVKPASMAQKVLFADRTYLDWLPYNERTIPRAKLYFDNGMPFTVLNATDTSKLSEYYTIRNALAHKSNSALKKFQNIISSFALLPHEKFPSGYLRSKPYSPSTQTQYQIAVLELEGIAKRLCA